MNSEVKRAFDYDHSAFFAAFPQLISRIDHAVDTVFETLKVRVTDKLASM